MNNEADNIDTGRVRALSNQSSIFHVLQVTATRGTMLPRVVIPNVRRTVMEFRQPPKWDALTDFDSGGWEKRSSRNRHWGEKKKSRSFFSPSNHPHHDALRKLREAQKDIKSSHFFDNCFVAHPIPPPLPLLSTIQPLPHTYSHAENFSSPLDDLRHPFLCPGGPRPSPRTSSSKAEAEPCLDR